MAVSDLGNKIIVRPNNSLSPQNGMKVMAGLLVIMLLVSFGFALMGAWLVLPFAGLEIIAFALAFHVVYLHANDFESISIEDERVVVEKRIIKASTTTVYQRYWAQVSIRAVDHSSRSNGKSGLFVGSHGKEVEFGKNLINDEQRAVLALALRQKLKNIY